MQIYRVGAIAFACAAGLSAQDKVSVPLSNPSQPATVKVHIMNGSINVVAGGNGSVAVEATGPSEDARERRGRRDVPSGMHRIDSGRAGMDIVEDHNVVTIGSGPNGSGDVTVTVPANSSLQLHTLNGGHIQVTGVSGEIEADDNNGSIELKNVSGSVVAHSLNGSVTVGLDRVTAGKPMAFTSLNGRIDVTLPTDTKARLRLKSDNGGVFSDFDVKTDPDSSKPVVEDSRGPNARHHIRMDRNVYGSINGGGPEFRFETMNGDILIHKK